MTRATCIEAVSHPGKFEGCAVYVPYLWDIGMQGCADDDDGYRYRFNINDADRQVFPELDNRRVVYLREDDNGFVYEC